MATNPFEPFIDAIADAVAARLKPAGPVIVPKVLTIEQAAVYLSRTPAAIRGMIATGKLVPVRLDGRVSIEVAELDRAIQAARG